MSRMTELRTPWRAFPDPLRPQAFYLERVRQHREAGELVRGIGYEWRGGHLLACAIGCTVESYDHKLYPEFLGIPVVLAHLKDWLFQFLPEGYLDWPERFLSAIAEGADLTDVFSAWSVRLLDRCLGRIGPGAEPWRVAGRDVVASVRDAMARGEDSADYWRAARDSAFSAALVVWESRDDGLASVMIHDFWCDRIAVEAASLVAEAIARAAVGAAPTANATQASWVVGSAVRDAAWNATQVARAAFGRCTGTVAQAAEAAEIRRQAEDLLELLAAAPESA